MLHPALCLAAEHMAHHRFLLADDDFNFQVASKPVGVCQFIGMCKSREWQVAVAQFLDSALTHSPLDGSDNETVSYQIVGAELGA